MAPPVKSASVIDVFHRGGWKLVQSVTPMVQGSIVGKTYTTEEQENIALILEVEEDVEEGTVSAAVSFVLPYFEQEKDESVERSRLYLSGFFREMLDDTHVECQKDPNGTRYRIVQLFAIPPECEVSVLAEVCEDALEFVINGLSMVVPVLEDLLTKEMSYHSFFKQCHRNVLIFFNQEGTA